MTLSAAWKQAKAGDSHSAGPGEGGIALRTERLLHLAVRVGIPDVCRFRATEKAIWLVGCAGTAPPGARCWATSSILPE
eukprot:15463438-Alexandrium_andersonii.AAC.1